MIPYRLYTLDADGRFVGLHEFVASNDEDAIAAAERQAAGQAFELWSFDRFVRKVRALEAQAEPYRKSAVILELRH